MRIIVMSLLLLPPISWTASSSSLPQKKPREEKGKRESAGISAFHGQTAQAPLSSTTTTSDSEMIYLRFSLKDHKLELQAQTVVSGNMKLPPLVVPANGFFHRILSKSGKVLAQGITQEPQLLYYDYPYPDGSGRLMGGVLRQSNIQFVVRYPLMADMDRIELFRIGKTSDLSRLSAEGDNYCGSFKLNTPAP